jgi:histidinol-phosphatase
MSEELKTAIDAAKKGAEYALQFYNDELVVEKKEDKTVVTRVDQETEELIKKIVLKKFPSANFVGEETGGSRESLYWCIDPIDGTRHFLRNTPLWAVLISLIKDGKPVLGVSYVPGMRELLYAEKGQGAFLNGEKVRVSKISELSDSIVLFGSMRFFKDKEILVRFINSSASARSLVSPYEFHLLASGRAEIVIDGYGKTWDIAPFDVIIEEAGGKVTDSFGQPWSVDNPGCVATNGLIHKEVIKIYNEK